MSPAASRSGRRHRRRPRRRGRGSVNLPVSLGPLSLRTPLIAASGTVGSVVEWSAVADTSVYGAAVAKSVSAEPWPGRPAPRLAPAGSGLLNGIGIQNPGIEAWKQSVAPELSVVGVPLWGSAVGTSGDEFVHVARELANAGVAAVEINLSCPNLDSGSMFALDPGAAAKVVHRVREEVSIPVGAKLSPNAEDIVDVALAVAESGADWVVLTNTIWGARIDIETGRPVLSGGVGGLSGPPLKPIAVRCVWEVRRAAPELPIVGCGGVRTGDDVVEFLLAGADAVAAGSVLLAEPDAGRRLLGEVQRYCLRHGISDVAELSSAAHAS